MAARPCSGRPWPPPARRAPRQPSISISVCVSFPDPETDVHVTSTLESESRLYITTGTSAGVGRGTSNKVKVMSSIEQLMHAFAIVNTHRYGHASASGTRTYGTPSHTLSRVYHSRKAI